MTTPLTLLTGFLGAGKTTLLNRILNAEHGVRVAVLVNDFGAINIDSALVTHTSVDGDTVSLANGCICCTIRGDLLQAVENLFDTDAPPEYILIEASGVSDPLEIALTFRDVPVMQALVHIDSIITVIDAEQFRDVERDHAVLAMNQVGMADMIVLNKVDLVSEDDLNAVEKQINHIMPKSRIFRTSHADVPLSLLLGVGTYDPERTAGRTAADIHVHGGDEDHHHHSDHAAIFDTWNWQHTQPLSLAALERTLRNLPATIYRLKGILYTHDHPEQQVIVQMVGRRVTLTVGEAWGTGIIPSSQIVAIGTQGGVDRPMLDEMLTASLYANVPKHPLARITQGVRSWLR